MNVIPLHRPGHRTSATVESQYSCHTHLDPPEPWSVQPWYSGRSCPIPRMIDIIDITSSRLFLIWAVCSILRQVLSSNWLWNSDCTTTPAVGSGNPVTIGNSSNLTWASLRWTILCPILQTTLHFYSAVRLAPYQNKQLLVVLNVYFSPGHQVWLGRRSWHPWIG